MYFSSHTLYTLYSTYFFYIINKSFQENNKTVMIKTCMQKLKSLYIITLFTASCTFFSIDLKSLLTCSILFSIPANSNLLLSSVRLRSSTEISCNAYNTTC